MISSIEAQKVAGSEDIVVNSDIFRSYYKGYTDWGNPDEKINSWPDVSYAKYFNVKTFRAAPLSEDKK